MEHATPDRELSSWKEIAGYLRTSIRTAQMWERDRSLPVRRLPGGRGRVSITIAELEAWKHSGDSSADVPQAPGPPIAVLRNRLAIAGVILLAVGTGLAAIVGLRPAAPAGFRIEQGRLIVTNANNRELWWKSMDWATATNVTRQNIWFGDLDGDGRTEVLFIWSPGQPGTGAELICYSQDGRERWRFVPGRAVRTSNEDFSLPFGIQSFAVARVGRERAMRIVVNSHHYLYYPSQIALLSPEGIMVREYWHSGGFGHMLVTDLDGDGAPEVLLAGVNNATKSATLVVLDPATMSGASLEDKPEYQLQGFAPGQERGRLLFPRSCINRLEPFAYVRALWNGPGEIGIEIAHRMAPQGASVFYHLNPDLSLKAMSVGGSFEHSHNELYSTGALRHPFDAKEAAELHHVVYRRPPGY